MAKDSDTHEAMRKASVEKSQNRTDQRTQTREIRNRVKELRHVNANEIQPNDKNWRVHDSLQQEAFRSVLDEVGFAGAVIAYENDEGVLTLIDGHLRLEEAQGESIPVLVLDVTEEEADLLLATYDPIGAMASSDSERIGELLQGVSATDASLITLLEDIDEQYGLHELTLPRQETDAAYADNPFASIDREDSEEEIAERTQKTEMLQPFIIYVPNSSIEETREQVAQLADKWGYDNATDVILRLIAEAYQENK